MKALLWVVRAALASSLCLVVLEVCARLDDHLSYGAPFWGSYGWQVLEMDDALGTRGKPGARYQKWRMNSLGYRGPELRTGTIRIVCFGASETFGIYESADQEYPRQLERKLNAWAAHEPFEVVNAAMVGQRVAEAIGRISQVVRDVHPRYATLYPAVQHYLWLPSVEKSLAPNVAAESGDDATPTVPEREEWRMVERVRNLAKQMLPLRIQTLIRQMDIDDYTATHEVMQRVPEKNVAVFEEHVARWVADIRAAGVEPVLITHATAFGDSLTTENRDLLIAWRKFYPMLAEDGFLDMERRMNDAMRRVAQRDHVLIVDAAHKIPPGPRYFADGGHFTDAGADLIADLLAETLEPVLGREIPDLRASER